jgi:hypothetical protein
MVSDFTTLWLYAHSLSFNTGYEILFYVEHHRKSRTVEPWGWHLDLREEVAGEWRKLHNGELQNLYFFRSHELGFPVRSHSEIILKQWTLDAWYVILGGDMGMGLYEGPYLHMTAQQITRRSSSVHVPAVEDPRRTVSTLEMKKVTLDRTRDMDVRNKCHWILLMKLHGKRPLGRLRPRW